MNNAKSFITEFKVGIFVVVGCAILVLMSLKVGKFKIFGGGKTYEVGVLFNNTEGLDKNGSAQISGVPVGKVKEILLENNKAKVILELRDDVVLKKDAAATIKTKGVLGEKFVEIEPGISNEVIPKQNGMIANVKQTMDLDKLISSVDSVLGDIKEVSVNLKQTLGGDDGGRLLKGIFSNIHDLAANLNTMVKRNDAGISNTVRNLETFSAVLARKTPELSDDLQEISKTLKAMLSENRGNVKDGIENIRLASEKFDKTLASINNIAEKMDRGEGTIGKLINDEAAYENLNKTLTGMNKVLSKTETIRTYFDMSTEYLFKSNESRSQMNLRVYPKSDYFYQVGGVSSPYGKFTRQSDVYYVNGVPVGTIKTETEKTTQLTFNAQVGKRLHNLEVRAGIFESTGGVGADYYAYNDKLKYTFEAFNFDKKNKAHVRAGVSYSPLKYLFVTGGVDDIMSKRGRTSAYIGAGVKFEDEDVKYLLSSAPLPIK